MLATIPVFALDPERSLAQYVHDVWQIRQGLPQNSVQTLLQSGDGYIWLGTQEGLVRFDGVRFVLFDKRNTPAFSNHDIQALMEDRDGRLWIGNRAGQVFQYDGGAFRAMSSSVRAPVRCLYQDRSGTVWVGTLGDGLQVADQGKLLPWRHQKRLGANAVTALCQDREQRFWIGTRGGLLVFENDEGSLTARQVMKDADISVIHEDPAGTLWVGTENQGLFHLSEQGPQRIPLEQGVNSIFSLVTDRDGNLWIGTTGHGLVRYRDGVATRYRENGVLSHPIVGPLLEDREGNLWVGTLGGGLNRFANSNVETLGRHDGLAEDVVWLVQNDSAGNLWFGTDRGGLQRYRDGRFESFKEVLGLKDDDLVAAVLRDRQDRLWVGTDTRGLLRWDGETLMDFAQAPYLFAGGSITDLCEDRQGTLWIGTIEHGLHSFREEKLTRFEPPGWPSETVFAVVEDKEGSLWVATEEGLCRISAGELRVFTEVDGLANRLISTLHLDARGDLWALSPEWGLNRYKDGVFQRFQRGQGLFEESILQILDDDENNLWLSSNRGVHKIPISSFDKMAAGEIDSLEIRTVDTADGMKSPECNFIGPGSGCKDDRGFLWFPTMEGAVCIDPNRLDSTGTPPPVWVERISADSALVETDSGNFFPPGTRQFEIHYTAPSFLAPQKIRFRYRLDGFDRHWIDAGTRRTAFYSKLPPGQYRFRVIAAKADGVWNEEGDALAFGLKPYYYQTRWFYFVCGIGFVLLGWSFHRLRVKGDQRHRRALAKTVAARTEALDHTKQELQNVNSELAVKARLAGRAEIATDVLHNIGNALNTALISTNVMNQISHDPVTTRLLNRMAAMVENREDLGRFLCEHPQGMKLPEALAQLAPVLAIRQQRFHRELTTLSKQIDQIKEIISVQKKYGQENKSLVNLDLNQLIEDVLQIYGHMLQAREIEVRFRPGAIPHIRASKSDLLQVVTNLVHNACEALLSGTMREKRRLQVRTLLDESHRVVVVFEDNGAGIAAEHLDKIFDHGFTTKQRGHGFGLHYCANIVGAVGGSLRAESDGPGKGARLILSFPARSGNQAGEAALEVGTQPSPGFST